MKKAFLIGCAIVALTQSAHADFHIAQPERFDGGAFECSVVGNWPVDRDTNPVYKINVNLMLSDIGTPTSMGVTMTRRTGTVIDRSQQYQNGTIDQTPGKMEWAWTGTRWGSQLITMIGTLYHNDRDGWMYRERQWEGGRLKYQMLSDCHPMEGGE